VGNECEASWDATLLDHVAGFDPFVAESDWTMDAPTAWSYGTDLLNGTLSTYGTNAYYAAGLADDPYSVEAVFINDPLALSVSEGYAGVVFAVQGSDTDPHFWTCLYEWNSKDLSVWNYDGGSSISIVDWEEFVDTSDGDTSIWRRVRVYYDGANELTCTFDNEDGDSGSVTVTIEEIWPDMSGAAGLRVYNHDANFLSFVLYR